MLKRKESIYKELIRLVAMLAEEKCELSDIIEVLYSFNIILTFIV